jgi:acyl dehydratase
MQSKSRGQKGCPLEVRLVPYEALLRVQSTEASYAWGAFDIMLYALGLGLGQTPLDRERLRFVYEEGLRVLPSFATVIAWGALPPIAQMGLDYKQVVQGDQGIMLHRKLPLQGRASAVGRVTGAVDKGAKGAIVFRETVLRDEADGAALATLTSSIFARADGGFGGPSTGGSAPHPRPDRAPDITLHFPTRPEQALLYRLSGDRNPLHADPAVAARAGFPRPILHGLCSYGITCAAVLEAYLDGDGDGMAEHHARFSAPVFPGETIAVDLWRDDKIVSFEARAAERDVTILRNGRAVLR